MGMCLSEKTLTANKAGATSARIEYMKARALPDVGIPSVYTTSRIFSRHTKDPRGMANKSLVHVELS
mgnify:CR=1 FL=1